MIRAIHHVQLAMPQGREAEAEAFYAGLLGVPRVQKPSHLELGGGCWFRSDLVEIHLGVDNRFVPAHKAHPALPGYDRFYTSDPFGNRIEILSPRPAICSHVAGTALESPQ